MADVVTWGETGGLDWAVCATAYPGESRSGDAFLVEAMPTGALVAVVDGLGHGDEAADVAERALSTLRATAGHGPITCLTACHGALRGSRGAAITVAVLDLEGGRLSWAGVGNVEAAVVRPRSGCEPAERWSVPMRGGVVGDRLPPLRESTAPLADGDVLVSATDGVMPTFLQAIDPSLSAVDIAQRLHRGHAREDDDTLVLVARRRTDRPPTGAVSVRSSR